MAKDKENDLEKQIKENQTILLADHYGVSPDFFKRNRELIERVNKDIKMISKNVSMGDSHQATQNLQSLQQLVSTSNRIKKSAMSDDLEQMMATTDDGFRQISGLSSGKEDGELVAFHSHLMSVYRNLVLEYRGVTRLIPELNRAINMIARDIMSVNEITKKSIYNVYKPDDYDSVVDTEIYDKFNKVINEEIIDRYKLEEKVRRYIKTALAEGAKPVVVYPYKAIVEMLKKTKTSMNNLTEASMGTESFLNNFERQRAEQTSIFKPFESYSRKFNTLGTEDSREKIVRSYESFVDSVLNDVVGKDMVQEYCMEGYKDLREDVRTHRDIQLNSPIPPNVTKEMMGDRIEKEYNLLLEQTKITPDINLDFKGQILNATKELDGRIEFFDMDSAPIHMAVNSVRRILKFNSYVEDKKYGAIAYGAKPQDKYTETEDPNDVFLNDSDFYDNSKTKKDRVDNVLDKFLRDNPDDNIKAFLNECLIIEHDAEDVVPITVSGQHVGYYVIEIAPYTGNVESINKRNSNFTDMFLSMGFQNDAALSPNMAGATGSFASGFSTPQAFGTGVSGEIPNLGNSGAGPIAGLHGQIGHISEGQDGSALNRNEIMKRIMFKVITKKLQNDDLEDDKNFKDAVMALIRDGTILQNKIKFTYVPAEFMVYFTPELDGNGIPQSILKDSLFTCYLYISSLMNTALTKLTRSSTRDKISLNIGRMKNNAESIRSIENSLTSRRLNVESAFTSLPRVLKSSSLTETIIEPVYDGEKLYNYENLQNSNQVDIDDNYTTKLLNSIIVSLNSPVTIMNALDEEEFASVAASKNAEYRTGLLQRQAPFGEQVTKLLRIIINGSGKFEHEKEFELDNVIQVFSPPEHLNMKNANDMFGTTDTYIENIVKVFSSDSESDIKIKEIAKEKFKIELYKEMMANLDFNKYDKLFEKCTKEAIGELQKRKKLKEADAKIEEEKIEFAEAGDEEEGGGEEESGGFDF